jgi:hypothetical protein
MPVGKKSLKKFFNQFSFLQSFHREKIRSSRIVPTERQLRLIYISLEKNPSYFPAREG